MKKIRALQNLVFSDLGLLVGLALVSVILHTFTNGQYGFHRDELDMLDNARYLAWGYVSYPPLTPFLARVALELFGPSLIGLRFFGALAQGAAMVLTGLMARELGGSRRAQIVAALAAAIAPDALVVASLFHYLSFDYLWWVLVAYLMLRLLKSDNPRWWLGIGAAIGLGLLTKYTMAFYVAGIVAGVGLTKARRYLASPWLWGGVALSALICLPNLLWQIQHQFISLDFLSSIHARDIQMGRTEGFLPEQLYLSANLVTLPLWVAGLGFYLAAKSGQRYRLLGWMFVVPLVLFLVAQGRGYYLAPAYPVLLAGGTVVGEGWLRSLSTRLARRVQRLTWGLLAVSGAAFAAVVLPLAPVNSAWWDVASSLNTELKEEIGWPELVKTVADIYTALPEDEKSKTTIFGDNYGEAGAINLYGPAYGLPEAVSGVNSYWLRGYRDPAAQTVIVLGSAHSDAETFFTSCDVAGRITNRYGVGNEETLKHPIILICRGPRQPWSEIWKFVQRFG